MKVGFAGMGMMGAGMARNLVKAEHDVTVFNRTRSKAESVRGAKIAETPGELCSADVIFTCVSNDAALREILFSDDGIYNSLSSRNILVDCSTTSVPFTMEIEKKCAKKGCDFLDAPVTGGKKGADEGELVFMAGGKKDALERIRRLLDAMGSRVVYCGQTSSGQRMKIALNLTQAMVLESYLEGLSLALKNDVPLDAAMEVLDNSGARSTVASSKMPSIIKHDFSPTFFLELMNKDMKLAEQEIRKLNMDLPLAKEIIKIMKHAHDKGWGTEDWTIIVRLLEEKNKARIEK